MPKDKERSVNPAAAQRKAEKQRALKKGRAAVTAQRNERLAHRNPERLQRQIDELKELQESRGGELSQRDKESLSNLERDVARIRKAKEAAGINSSAGPDGRDGRDGDRRAGGGRDNDDGRRPGQGQVLGKRGRGHDRHEHKHRSRSGSKSSATDNDVRDIPMPRDTPPPIPAQRRSRWSQRDRPHWQDGGQHHRGDGGHEKEEQQGERGPHKLPPKPGGDAPQRAPVQSQKVYESKPVMRDLQREAAAAFVPSAVKKKLDAVRGGVDQPLLEEEELEKLEKEGYVKRSAGGAGDSSDSKEKSGSIDEMKDSPGGGGNARTSPARGEQPDGGAEDEMTRFSRDVRNVQIEEVEDEDA